MNHLQFKKGTFLFKFSLLFIAVQIHFSVSAQIPHLITEEYGSVNEEGDLRYFGVHKNVIIPPYLFGREVLKIGYEAFHDMELESVKIPNTVTEIVLDAFSYNNLTSVEIPNSVTKIGEAAFGYNNLTEINIPNQLTELGYMAFAFNEISNEITIPGTLQTIGDYALYFNKLTDVNILDGVRNLNVYAFSDNMLEDIQLPNSVYHIELYAFADNVLTTIILPSPAPDGIWHDFAGNEYAGGSEVSIVGKEYIYECTDYTIQPEDVVVENGTIISYSGPAGNLRIPEVIGGETIVAIGHSAFREKGISSIEIPETVTSIGYFAFYDNLLTSVTIPDGVGSIDSYAFYSNWLTEVSLPDGLEQIGSYSFYGNKLSNLTLPTSLKSIGDRAFMNNELLAVDLPGQITSLGLEAFYGNSGLVLTLSNSLHHIGKKPSNNLSFSLPTPEYDGTWFDDNGNQYSSGQSVHVYYQYAYLAEDYEVSSADVKFENGVILDYFGPSGSILIPDLIDGQPVTAIGSNAFREKGLTEVVLPQTIDKIGSHAFIRNNLTAIELSNTITEIGIAAFANNQLTQIAIPNQLTRLENSIFHNNLLTEIIIPNSIQYIGDYSFKNNELTSVDIPENVLEIGEHAYESNQLLSLTLHEGIESIGNNAFFNNQLTNVVLPNTVLEMGYSAFCVNELTNITLSINLKSLSSGVFFDNNLTSFVIPENIIEIGSNALGFNQLESITLHENIHKIGRGAFALNNLTEVSIPQKITKISQGTFRGNLLNEIILHEGITFIGDQAFEDNQLENVDIPDGVEYIGEEAFMNNVLTEFELPLSSMRGYSVDGWAANDGTLYNAGDVTTDLISSYGLNFTAYDGAVVSILIEKTNEASITITGDVNETIEHIGSVNFILEVDQSIVITPNVPDGYDVFPTELTIDNIQEDVAQKFTLDPIEYSITYMGVYDLSGFPENFTIEDNIELPIPSRDGFSFVGWYTDAEYTLSITTIEKGTIGDIFVYAKFVDSEAPLPDLTSLPNVSDQCVITDITAPTALDAVDGMITGTTDATFPITSTTTITWTYTDESGNSSTQTQEVIIEDVTAPVADLGFLPDLEAECEVIAPVAPIATDNCDGEIAGTTDVIFPLSTTTTVTWTYTDESGNISTQTQEVIIEDVSAPVADLGVLPDLEAECEVIVPTAPTATDNCDGEITGTTDAVFPLSSTTTITWTYTDESGNSSTQTQEVIIEDVTAPVADLGVLPDLEAECEVIAPVAPIATDNCDGEIAGTTDVIFPLSTTTTVTWTYTDESGNISTQTQEVIIEDVSAPVADLGFLPDLEAECEVIAPTAPTATDNCDGEITGTTDAVFPLSSTTTMTWTYTDGTGNSSIQTQEVIIEDVTAPVADLGVLPNLEAECEVLAPPAPTATDNCDGGITGTTDATFPLSTTTTVTWTYTDESGNSSTQTQEVIIEDETAPVANLGVLADLEGECEVMAPTAPTATDNCDGEITGSTDVVFPLSSTTTMTWTYTDGTGNSSIQTQEVIIEDVTAPVADLDVLPNLDGECEVLAPPAPTATDNCDGGITGTTDAVFPLSSTTTIIWTYIDGTGNSSTQTQEVIIEDVTAPVADLGVLPNLEAECEVLAPPAPTATDNCDGEITGTTDAIFPLTSTTTIIWTFTDYSGNSSSQTQKVIIQDVSVPVPDEIELSDLVSNNSVSLPDAPTATDNCDGILLGTTDAIFPLSETTTIMWTYTDQSGNSISQTQTVIVDNITGVSNDKAGKIDIYPNPAINKITIDQLPNNQTDIFLFSLDGREIMRQVSFQSIKKDIDVSSIDEGVYILQIKNNDVTSIFKVVVMR